MKLPKISDLIGGQNSNSTQESPKVPKMDRDNLGKKEVYLVWESLNSIQDKKGISQKFIKAFTIIGIFVGLLLLIMQEFFVILIVGSLIFVTQAMMKMTPESVKYEISNHGIYTGDDMYYWDKLRRFFFFIREGQEVVAIDTAMGFPARIFVPFEAKDKNKLKEILEKYLHFLESEPRTFFDNAYDRVINKFGLEDTNDSSVEKGISKP